MENIVELKRVPHIGFGFSIIGGSDTHIPPMVCALVKNSPALHSRQISVGDVLCKVNGVSVLHLETKQVVDLIRDSKDNITLSLKEDRLAKLKARPFLAEDGLIDPPVTPINTLNQNTFQRTVGSPKNYEYGTDGKFTQRGSMIHSKNEGPNTQTDRSINTYSNDIMSHSTKLQLNNRMQANQNTFIATGHVYDLDNLPRSPRELDNSVNYSSRQQYSPKSKRDISNELYHNNQSKNHSVKVLGPKLSTTSSSSSSSLQDYNDGIRTDINKSFSTHTDYNGAITNSLQVTVSSHSTIQTQRINYPSSKSHYSPVSAPASIITDPFRFPLSNSNIPLNKSSATPTLNRSRPHSNPDIEQTPIDSAPLAKPESSRITRKLSSNQSQVTNFDSSYYESSPNVYESERLYSHSERKNLTLTPNSLSVQLLDQPEHFEENNFHLNNKNLHQLTLNTPSDNDSSFEEIDSIKESDIFDSNFSQKYDSRFQNSSSSTENDISPADIASRLFTLNGYKDEDVAPILGKNNDFSQQVCREYLRFFNFEGRALDEALRLFLQKFSLTGETQERERVLIHFSKRYYECNPDSNMSEDSLHTLICAMMLLNTDLHGHSITNKMTLNDFINNLNGLCDGKDFPKEQLKTIYNAIKSKEIVFTREKIEYQNSPRLHKKKIATSLSSNPFVELKANSNDAIICEGLVYRKSVMDSGGRRTPALRRNWRPFYCVLKGLILLNYKPENLNAVEPFSIGIHHSLAGYAKDYKKRAYVFKLITADWSVYYIQVKNQEEVRLWMDSLNVAAALLSAPPLPAPVGSSLKFQRPVMPVSRTKLSLAKQIEHHADKACSIENELADHVQWAPEPHSKMYLDWENKLDFLDFELKRFKAYTSVLTVQRLAPIREKIIKYMSQNSASNTLPKSVERLQVGNSHSSL